MGRRRRTAKRKTREPEEMASFGIFLHFAILCFFIVSKVHGYGYNRGYYNRGYYNRAGEDPAGVNRGYYNRGYYNRAGEDPAGVIRGYYNRGYYNRGYVPPPPPPPPVGYKKKH